MAELRLLFVCTGNICRSPTAEAVLRRRIEEARLGAQVEIESAGLGGWHVGDPPDPRAVGCAAARGYDLTPLRARQFRAKDFDQFELIVGMDRGHLRALRARRPEDARGELHLFLEFLDPHDPDYGRDVPDPYAGTEADYERSLDLIERGAPGLVAALARRMT